MTSEKVNKILSSRQLFFQIIYKYQFRYLTKYLQIFDGDYLYQQFRIFCSIFSFEVLFPFEIIIDRNVMLKITTNIKNSIMLLSLRVKCLFVFE